MLELFAYTFLLRSAAGKGPWEKRVKTHLFFEKACVVHPAGSDCSDN